MRGQRLGPPYMQAKVSGLDSERQHGAGDRVWLSVPVAWQQAALMAVILILTAVLALLGLGMFSRFFFIVAALSAAAFYIRQSPWHYVTLTFWFWTLTPLARRIIDYNAGFDPVNFVLATPNLLTLFMLKDVAASRDLLRQRETLTGLFLLLPILYGLFVSFVQGDVVPGLIASADWIAPLLYYFYIIASWRRVGEAEEAFRHFLSANGFVLVSYGNFQYFAPLSWDIAWVINSGMVTVGHPEPYGLRVFSTLNAPGVLAIWAQTLLLLFLHFRTRTSSLLVPAAVLLLLLTFVRSALGTVVLGLLLAGLMGRAGTFKVLGIAILGLVLVGAGVSATNPEMADQVAKRFDTLNDLGSDGSALAREALYQMAPDLIDANPLGIGIGSLGRGANAGQAASAGVASVGVDSGIVWDYLCLGWVAGSVYLVGTLLALAQALMAARLTRSPAALALAVAAVSGAANLVFTNTLGFFAAIIWTCAAYAAAIGIDAREYKTSLPRRVTESLVQ